jgi:hypothetical protein
MTLAASNHHGNSTKDGGGPSSRTEAAQGANLPNVEKDASGLYGRTDAAREAGFSADQQKT